MSTSPMQFEKFEGAGNDFILIRCDSLASVTPEQAKLLCDRNYGIGADGVLLVLPSQDPSCAAYMHVLNADGSTSEMCGNGIRCVAHMLAAATYASTALRIESGAGPRDCLVEREHDVAQVTVAMGHVTVGATCMVHALGEPLELQQVNAGNPHAVAFGAWSAERISELGPLLGADPAFRAGANIGFAQLRPGGLDLRVYERGAGWTLACGTGACAAAAAAWSQGRAVRGPLEVALPGGALTISERADGQVLMRGPARRVFGGQLAPQFFEVAAARRAAYLSK